MMNTMTELYGIYDDEYNLVFPDAVITTASITEEADLMTHPLEDGASIVDHRVIKPVQIQISMTLNPDTYQDTYKLVKQAFMGNDVFTINTKAGIYNNMALAGIPHEESPAQFDTIVLALKFIEAKFVETQFQILPPVKVKNKNDSSTVNKGEQPAEEVSEKKRYSFLYAIFGLS